MEGMPIISKSSAICNIKKEGQERKRNILYLIVHYLRSHNLSDSADSLRNEAQLNQYEVCDNIDLDLILQEYESYYMMKFQKMPKIIRRVEHDQQQNQTQKKVQRYGSKTNQNPPLQTLTQQNDLELKFDVIALNNVNKNKVDCMDDFKMRKIQEKSLCDFEGYSNEWKEMAEQIMGEVVKSDLNIYWKDCIGLNDVIELLKEAVVYPISYPSIFNGLIKTWKGILLYGPPGTGKTLLAKALASETEHTFINVTNSAFISKWRGDSEKMVKVLFDVAKFYAPSIIFVDELDSIAFGGHEDFQHEASRRFRSELLTQLDGILRKDDQVFILATTNTPWKLDAALLRRFEKRILVNLPDEQARISLFEYFLKINGHEFPNNELKYMADATKGFSGSDIKLVCKETIMNTVREKLPEIKKDNNSFNKIKLRKPNVKDIMKAVQKTKPTYDENFITKYLEWQKKFGVI